MSPFGFIVVAFMLGLVAMSFAFAGGAVIVVLPVAVLVIAGIAALEMRKHVKQSQSVHDFRENAKSSKVDFDERDEQTLVSE
jgi:Flp pilus assembly protein TadB